MNTVDNKTDLQKAMVWWELGIDGGKRGKLLIEWFGATNVEINNDDILLIWQKETGRPAPTNTDRELKCTPGEWYSIGPKVSALSGNQIYFSIQTKYSEIRGHSYLTPGFYYPHSVQTPEEMQANANLIASAPNLYNALKEIVDLYIEGAHLAGKTDYAWPPDIRVAIEALKKANPNYNVTQ